MSDPIHPEGIYQCEGCARTYPEYVNGCVDCWDDDLTGEQNRAKYPHRSVRLVLAEPAVGDVPVNGQEALCALAAIARERKRLVDVEQSTVLFARSQGMSWRQLADALGTQVSNVHRKYAARQTGETP